MAHNRDARVALLYDVKHSIQMPVGPPLPFAPLLSSEPVAATGAAAAAAATGAPQSPTSATVADWLFLPPNLVLDKRAGLLLELRINLEEISVCHGGLYRLLLRHVTDESLFFVCLFFMCLCLCMCVCLFVTVGVPWANA